MLASSNLAPYVWIILPEHLLAKDMDSDIVLFLFLEKRYAAKNISPAPVKSTGVTLSLVTCVRLLSL